MFSTAVPGQGGIGDINLRPNGYWVELFERRGHRQDPAATERLVGAIRAAGVEAPWLMQNIMIYKEAGPPTDGQIDPVAP